MSRSLLLCAFCFSTVPGFADDAQWIVYDGKEGPGKGKHIVFVTGDDEYRSEESMPQLAKILSQRHGFKCTVLFAIDPKTGAITPNHQTNIPGLEALESADLMVMFLRFRSLPPKQMKYIEDYTNSGKPIVALRTSTHPFSIRGKDHPYQKWHWRNGDKKWKGGYGRQVLGETWVSHYGRHQRESTRGIPAEGQKKHPIWSGIDDIWGPSDVYGIRSLSGDSKPIVMGQVLEGMKQTDKPKEGKKLVPVAWTKTWKGDSGKTTKVFTTTMGHGGDLENEGVRRMCVNATYWLLGMSVPKKADVALVGEYNPTPIGFGKFKKGVKPSDHALKK